MYSPKIREDLIPRLYVISKRTGKPMTILVDDMLREGIKKLEQEDKNRLEQLRKLGK